MATRYGRTLSLVLGLLATSSTARAQNVFNPYGNSGMPDYREFATPMYSNNPSLPGQARLQGQQIGGRSRANQFESYTDSLNGRDTDLDLGSRNGQGAAGAGVPYYRTYRQYDQQFKRVYKPNDSDANRKFEERMKRRNAAYIKALEEKDPGKRARLLRLIDQDVLDRPTTGRPSTAATAAANPARRSANRPTPEPPAARSPAPTDPRGPAARPSALPRAATPEPPATTAPAPASPASNPSSIPIPPPR